MSGKDAHTLSFYANEAGAYTSRGQNASPHLVRFMHIIPPGGSVLELGCGAGQDSEAMIRRGFDVTPTDGTPEIARAAELRLGRPVKVLLFDDIAEQERYDGIWANACLLHIRRTRLAPTITRIHVALKPGGLFYASFKAGDKEGRDTFGRYYNYPDAAWLRRAFDRSASWAAVEIHHEMGSGYDGQPTKWLHVLASKYD